PEVRLVRGGTPVAPAAYTRSVSLGGKSVAGVCDPVAVWAEFHRGATIVLQSLHRWWLPLTRFCRDIELELTHPVQANAYVTPPGERGLGVHYDTHDVFVLQVAGHKRWTLYEPVLELPLPSQPWSSATGGAGAEELSVDLGPGDCLYVPRGVPHQAESQESVSVHVTLGVLAVTWHDVVRDLVAATADDLAFRRPLPAGFASGPVDDLVPAVAATVEDLQAFLAKVDPAQVAEEVIARFWRGRPPILAGHLTQLSRLETLGDESLVRRRPGSVCRLAMDGDWLVVLLGDRELRMPADAEPAVAVLAAASGEPLAVADLAAVADRESRRVLVHRLVREGLLEVLG
ncbi:MAG: bifunctional lysine-specific demethylase and histidyl-hydroxylase, partial [Actinomycetota bacterium]|nr:bifunctional lysine-specific demethylase and histidyl-hydroxylase [Actinomycetota bacterium]